MKLYFFLLRFEYLFLYMNTSRIHNYLDPLWSSKPCSMPTLLWSLNNKFKTLMSTILSTFSGCLPAVKGMIHNGSHRFTCISITVHILCFFHLHKLYLSVAFLILVVFHTTLLLFTASVCIPTLNLSTDLADSLEVVGSTVVSNGDSACDVEGVSTGVMWGRVISGDQYLELWKEQVSTLLSVCPLDSLHSHS